MRPEASLQMVKIVHTVIWAFFAGCIVAIPFFGLIRRFSMATALIVIVSIEVMILAFNRMRCPLTDVAARYTGDRRDNFDIYLPLWIARYNKEIFGMLYLGGILVTLLRWVDWI